MLKMEIACDNRNVNDFYKDHRLTKWTTELIKKDLKQKAFPFAVMMENLQGDFNLGSVIRSANAFNANEVYYLGRKRYDKRGTVGTYHYTDVKHLKDYEELKQLKEKYVFVALENTVDSAVPMAEFKWPSNALIICGEEGLGITKETLALCDSFVFIPQYGSVRSLNAAVASSIAMNHYVTQYQTGRHDTL
jgi:tRNA G18 (ribose-2'-O)-methylase SpoU